MNRWICTDPDNLQFCKEIEPFVWDFKEYRLVDEYFTSLPNGSEIILTCLNDPEKVGKLSYADRFMNSFECTELTISLKEYTLSEMTEYIKGYYSDLGQLISIYGESSDQIVAECIFEQESGLY